jgi:hypothetical protein
LAAGLSSSTAAVQALKTALAAGVAWTLDRRAEVVQRAHAAASLLPAESWLVVGW